MYQRMQFICLFMIIDLRFVLYKVYHIFTTIIIQKGLEKPPDRVSWLGGLESAIPPHQRPQ